LYGLKLEVLLSSQISCYVQAQGGFLVSDMSDIVTNYSQQQSATTTTAPAYSLAYCLGCGIAFSDKFYIAVKYFESNPDYAEKSGETLKLSLMSTTIMEFTAGVRF